MLKLILTLCLLLSPALAVSAPLVERSPAGADMRDITLEIQGAVQRGDSVELPAGDFAISETIRVVRRYGWTLSGAGRGEPNAWIGGWNGRSGATCLVWTGAPNKPMFELPGSPYFNVRDIGFAGTAETVGFLLPPDPGWGTGSQGVFRDVSFSGFRAGVQCGTEALGWNCADIKFFATLFQYCNAGLLVKNAQGVNYFFFGVDGAYCKALFHFERGGSFHAYGGNLSFVDTCLKVDNADVNNGLYSLDGFKVETPQHPTCLVDAKAAWIGRVSVSSTHAASSGVLFKIGTGLSLSVRDSVLFVSVPLEAKSSDRDRPASADFDACTFYGAAPKKGVNAEVSWRNCRSNAVRMTDRRL